MSSDKLRQIKDLLKLHYGFSEFRSGQQEALENILRKKDTLVIMPTGGGKSLIYQLPALVLEGVTVVVSPLIALMKDQVDFLNSVGIPATFINSSISPQEAKERIEKIQGGFYKLLYIAPERFNNQEFVKLLENIKVDLFAVDEAHCISEWGHDFRPSYTRLNQAINILGKPPVVALTATATPEVREDIIKQLDLSGPAQIVTGFRRPNLQLGVARLSETQKASAVLSSVRSLEEPRGIIYVGTRAKVDELTQILLQEDFKAVAYHAGMEAEERKWVQEKFMKDEVDIIIATNAFGLGIDKKDIRFIIHHNTPGTVEAYYQEAGRAGRDGRSSFCLLFFSPKDRHLQEFFIQGDNPSPETILEVYDILLSYEQEQILFTYSEIGEALSDNVPEMAIGTSLKILEKNGLLRRSREKAGNAYLKAKEDFKTIEKKISPKAQKQTEAWAFLKEKYGDELTQGAYFSWEEVADLTGVKKETLKRLARSLSEKGVLEYCPPFRGTEVRILQRLSREDTDLDYSSLKEKRKRAYEKLDKIEDYIYHSGCRQEFILNYFGDREAAPCGKCDNCLSSPAASEARPKKEKKKSKLNTKLTQLETFDLYKRGLGIEEIAEKRGLSSATIVNHLCYLIEKKLVKDIDGLVDKKIQAKIKKAVKKTGKGKLKPIFEELEEKVSYEEIKFSLAKNKSKNE